MSTCVKVSLTSNCRAATQSSQLVGNEALHKPKGNRTLTALTQDTHSGLQAWGSDGIALPRVCQMVCHRKPSQAAMGNSANFFHTQYNRAQVLQTKGHAQKHIQKYSKLKLWPSPRYLRCQWSCARIHLMIQSQSYFSFSKL